MFTDATHAYRHMPSGIANHTFKVWFSKFWMTAYNGNCKDFNDSQFGSINDFSIFD